MKLGIAGAPFSGFRGFTRACEGRLMMSMSVVPLFTPSHWTAWIYSRIVQTWITLDYFKFLCIQSTAIHSQTPSASPGAAKNNRSPAHWVPLSHKNLKKKVHDVHATSCNKPTPKNETTFIHQPTNQTPTTTPTTPTNRYPPVCRLLWRLLSLGLPQLPARLPQLRQVRGLEFWRLRWLRNGCPKRRVGWGCRVVLEWFCWCFYMFLHHLSVF